MINVGSPQFLFMAEAEGMDDLVDTHTAKLNSIINEINENYYNATLEVEEVVEIARRHGIAQLRNTDLKYIAARI